MTNRKTCQNIMPDSFPIFAPISLVGGVPECYSNMLAVAKKKKKKTAFGYYNIILQLWKITVFLPSCDFKGQSREGWVQVNKH